MSFNVTFCRKIDPRYSDYCFSFWHVFMTWDLFFKQRVSFRSISRPWWNLCLITTGLFTYITSVTSNFLQRVKTSYINVYSFPLSDVPGSPRPNLNLYSYIRHTHKIFLFMLIYTYIYIYTYIHTFQDLRYYGFIITRVTLGVTSKIFNTKLFSLWSQRPFSSTKVRPCRIYVLFGPCRTTPQTHERPHWFTIFCTSAFNLPVTLIRLSQGFYFC